MRANDTAPLVVINQVAPIYVSFSVPGRYLPEIRQGQAKRPLQIQVRDNQGGAPGAIQIAPAAPGTEASPTNGAQAAPSGPRQASFVKEGGVVSFIDNAVDPTTGTIKLKGTFDNADHALWPGLFVQVTLVLGNDPTAVVVPAAAVQASQAGQYVFVVNADRTVEMRTVKIARQQGEEMVIAQGLKGGEEVVTDGHLRLNPGSGSPPVLAARARARLDRVVVSAVVVSAAPATAAATVKRRRAVVDVAAAEELSHERR